MTVPLLNASPNFLYKWDKISGIQKIHSIGFSLCNVQEIQFSHSVVPDSVTPWTAAHQASLSINNSWSLLKLMSIKSMMPSNYLILCHPLLLLPSIFPSIRSIPMSRLFASAGQSIGISASASVLPINIQG